MEIIAGSANNQILSATVAEEVFRRGILYTPDYVINAGGLVNVYVEMQGYDQRRALRLTRQISGRLRNVFALSRELNVPTRVAADRIAEARLGASRFLPRAPRPLDSNLKAPHFAPLTPPERLLQRGLRRGEDDHIERAYDPPRGPMASVFLWNDCGPGISKAALRLDGWLKEVGPYCAAQVVQSRSGKVGGVPPTLLP